MKKKSVLLGLISLFSCASIAGAAILFSKGLTTTANSTISGYHVTLDGSNYYQGVNQSIETSTGQYEIPFLYTEATPGVENEYHCVLEGDGTITHGGEIRFITSIFVDFECEYDDYVLVAKFSNDGYAWSDYSYLQDEQEFEVDDQPYYVEIKSYSFVTIKSLTINYSCLNRQEDPNIKTVTIYATNDMHGQIYPDVANKRMGMAKMMSYLKRENDGDTLVLDQGDTWQGSLYSNLNYGNLINDMMSYVGYNARTIGNHDFDWGIDKLVENTNRSYGGYTIPVLAANVYDYNFDTKEVGTTQQSQIGRKSLTYTLDNGLKVGIVGVIGSSQISSINSLVVHDVTFIDHVNVLKEEATKLRADGCDLVIGSIHGPSGDVRGYHLDDYFDLMLCGHSHSKETFKEGDLYYPQFGSYTEYLGKIELKYNTLTNKVSTNVYSITPEGMESLIPTDSDIDPAIQNLIDTNYSSCEEAANQVLVSNVNGYFTTAGLANLVAEAIYEKAKPLYDVDLVVVNYAREQINKESWTYADIYQSFPFDNDVYVFDVDPYDMRPLLGQYVCHDPSLYISHDQTYKVAILDFVAYRTDSNRNYNYSWVSAYDPKTTPKLDKNYREILKDYLLTKDSLDYHDYSRYLAKFSSNPSYESYTVTYHLNDGSGDTFTNDTAFDLNVSMPYETPSRSGYIFDGWYMDPECSEPFDFDTPSHEDDAYAKWDEVVLGSYRYYSNSPMSIYYGKQILQSINEDDSSATFDFVFYNWFSYGEFSFEATGATFALISFEININNADTYNSADVTPTITETSTGVYKYTFEINVDNIGIQFYLSEPPTWYSLEVQLVVS